MPKREDYKTLKNLLDNSRNEVEYVKTPTGLLLPKSEYVEQRKIYCRGCAKKKTNPKPYCGELFCGDCVDKWKSGKR